MKFIELSKCGLAVLLLTGSECVATETAGRGQEVANWRKDRSTPTGVAFSPDGRHLVTGSLEGTATVWDLSAGIERFTVPGHRGSVWSVAFSPSSGQFLTGAGDGENNGKLWDAESGALLRTFPPSEGTDWLESGPFRGRSEGHGQRVEVVGFSPDGKRVLTGSHDGRVIVWDAATAQFQFVLGKHGGPRIHAAGFSPDGRTVAIGDYAAGITVWDGQTGHELRRFSGHSNAIEFLAWFPDSRRMVTASHDSTARIWDTRRGSQLQILRGHQGGGSLVWRCHRMDCAWRPAASIARPGYGMSEQAKPCSCWKVTPRPSTASPIRRMAGVWQRPVWMERSGFGMSLPRLSPLVHAHAKTPSSPRWRNVLSLRARRALREMAWRSPERQKENWGTGCIWSVQD